jgi:tetratricopeptide (TPR) repeat protein
MFLDRRGLPVTAANTEAVAHLDATVDAYLGFRSDTSEHLKRALAADPEMALALCTRGYFLKLFATRALDARAAAACAAAKASLARRGSTPREHRHVEALAAWCRGEQALCAEILDVLLGDDPLDPLAIRVGHFHDFYSGDAALMRSRMAAVLPAWSEDVPGYGYVLGCQAFALEESGAYEEAERTGRAALERHPTDIWATHAVAHVMEMQDRAREGAAFLSGLRPHWDGINPFVHHVFWHQALFHLELGEHDAVLALYDEQVQAPGSQDGLDMANAASLLWRLDEEGVAVGERWSELADRADARRGDHSLAFVDVHAVMALAGAGRLDRAALYLDSLATAARGVGDQADVLRAVGLELGHAVLDARRGRHRLAARRLDGIAAHLTRIGGSHAQRDVFQRLRIVEHLRAGDTRSGAALLERRRADRPGNVWAQHLTYALAGETGATATR